METTFDLPVSPTTVSVRPQVQAKGTKQVETITQRKLSPKNIFFIVGLPILTLIAAPLTFMKSGIVASDLYVFLAMYFLTGLGITAGYHRYYSHRAFDSNWLAEVFFLFFGAGALQNSAIAWSSDHRYHHGFVDQEADPYNINKGFFWAHMKWIFFTEVTPRPYENVSDLKRNPLAQFQHRHYLAIAALSAAGVPLAIGFLIGRPWESFLWGTMIRQVVVHQGTFLINSAAHCWGTQPFSKEHTAKDNPWLAFFTYGEGYHNFHHTFANDFRNGRAWYDWDPTKWLIQGFSWFGMCRNLKRTPDAVIERARAQAAQT